MDPKRVKLIRAQIHLTNKCNLRCKYCEIPVKFANSKDLSDDKWMDIVKELIELKVNEITISGGGEPTLRFELLIKILELLSKNRIKVGVITNGTMVNYKYAKKIVENSPNDWRTSICSPIKKTDSFLRGKDLLTKTFKGLEYIVKWRKKLKSGERPQVKVWMVLTNYNISHIPLMIKKASKIGVDCVCLRMVNPPNSWLYPTKRQRELFKKNLEGYKKLAEKLDIELRVYFSLQEILPESESLQNREPRKEERKIMCLIPFHEIVVFADGRVSPCCRFIVSNEDSIAVENCTKRSLKEIWFGEKFNLFRKRILENKVPEECKNCTPDFKFINKEYNNNKISS